MFASSGAWEILIGSLVQFVAWVLVAVVIVLIQKYHK